MEYQFILSAEELDKIRNFVKDKERDLLREKVRNDNPILGSLFDQLNSIKKILQLK